MIRTVTLNSGFDDTFTVTGLKFGGVADVLSRRSLPSGKGINSSRIMNALGADVTTYALVGGDDFDLMTASLKDENLHGRLARVPGRTRRNLTLLVEGRTEPAAHFRAAGFRLPDDGPVRLLLEMLASDTRAGDIVSLHGGTPEGLSMDTWCWFAAVARERKAQIVADVYGEALLQLFESYALLACKPNEEEVNVIPQSVQNDILPSLRYLATRDIEHATVSLGSRGLAFVEGGRFGLARYSVERPRMLVGAGDACIAGLLVALSRGSSGIDAVRAAVATASAHVEGCELTEIRARSQRLSDRVVFKWDAPETFFDDAKVAK